MATTEETKAEETTTEEVVATTDEKKDEDKTVEELKAEAEALEKELKELKGSKEQDELRQNQLRRLQKVREKKESLLSQTEERPQKTEDVEVRDLLTLSKQEIPEDSDKAEVLKRYKDAGLIKSYAEGLESVAVKAEFDAIDAKNNAKAIIDENSDEETRLKSTKEVIRQYQASGEIPQDPKLQSALARENLKSMGF